MSYKTLKFSNIDEVMYVNEHENGLKSYVIPKKGYMKKHATFSTHYGSINKKFKIEGETDIIEVPDGIAHFLEHKLFEQKDGNVMDKFIELGASSNAYTGFAQTVYLFTCTDLFDENFDLLLNFVQNPYITEESVEREKGIIGQEIDMYKDDPSWNCYFNLLKAFYTVNPVRVEIAGSKESISEINKDTLYMCYKTFYNPSNMVICVVGDVDPQKVFQQIDEKLSQMDKGKEIERIFPKENDKINKPYVEQKLVVSTPMFQMGFADTDVVTKGIDGVKKEVAIKIILDMLAGRSSELYSRLYNEGVINSSFDIDYLGEENYSFSIFGGESSDPKKVRDSLVEEVEKVRQNGLDREVFERVKKSQHGKYVRQLNSIDVISHNFISAYFKNANMFDYLDVYDKIKLEDASEVFKKHFNVERLALSVILPA